MTDIPDLNLLDEPQAPRQRGLSAGSIVLLVGIVAVAVVVGLALLRQQQTQPTSGQAPTFTVTTFDGQTLRLEDLRGKVVVLNFWASWCVPCRAEAPALETIWQRYRERDVVMLGVAYVDAEGESRKFIEEFGLTYPNAPDVGTRISDSYNIQGVPETFVIDQQGNVAEFFFAQVTEESLSRTLDRLLEAG